jgi:hypothetical protein
MQQRIYPTIVKALLEVVRRPLLYAACRLRSSPLSLSPSCVLVLSGVVFRGWWESFPQGFVSEWVCANNPAHVWQAPLGTRSNGAGCPECRQVGKSRVELDYHRAVEKAFGRARSGAVLRDAAFTTRQSWTADITVTIDAKTVVIEYDGAYWRAPPAKQLVDERKTLDFLAAGYRVVRLREDPLPILGIEHPHLLQTWVYPSAHQPEKVIAQIVDWLTTTPAGGAPYR